MTTAADVRAAIAELDSEYRQLLERLDEVAEQRAALAALLPGLKQAAVQGDAP